MLPVQKVLLELVQLELEQLELEQAESQQLELEQAELEQLGWLGLSVLFVQFDWLGWTHLYKVSIRHTV
jgi:hypothetical protein